MFAFGLALMLFAAPPKNSTVPPRKHSQDQPPPGLLVPDREDGNVLPPPKPREILPQQKPFQQLAAYEPELKTLLSADPLLARPITIKQTYISIRRVLELASDSQTTLRVTGDAADLRLQLALKNRPISALMRSLAQMLPGTWTREPDGKTYTLHQTAAAEKYQRDWWSVWQQEYDRVHKAEKQQILNFLRADPSKVNDYNTPQIAPAALFMEGYTLRRFLHGLPADIQERLAGQNTDFYFYSGYGGEKVEGAITLPWKNLSADSRELLKKRFAQWRLQRTLDAPDKAAEDDLFVVRLQNLGRFINVQLISPNSDDAAGGSVDVQTYLNIPNLPLTHGRLHYFFPSLKNLTPPTWRTLDQFAAATVWETPEVKKPYPLWYQQYRRQILFREPIPDILNRLHESQGVEFIVECSSVPYERKIKKGIKIQTNVPPMTEKIPTDIAQILPIFAEEHDESWRKSDEGIYLVRGNRWYRQDAAIVPEAQLLEWQKAFAVQNIKLGAVIAPESAEEIRRMLDLDAEVVQTLSVWQIAAGLRWVSVPAPPDASDPDAPPCWLHPLSMYYARLLRTRYTLKWYAGLTAEQREWLVQGRLPVSTMTPAQKSQLEFVLPDVALADPNRPQFVGVKAIPTPTKGFGMPGGGSVEGGWDNRTGIELILCQPDK